MRAARGALVSTCLAVAACGGGSRAPEDTTTTAPSTTATPGPESAPADRSDAVVEIELRLDRRVDDPATDDFERVVEATLTDPRGWQQAGFRFAVTDGPDAPYVVVLAEGDVVDELCWPYDVGGRYSCQLGPTVALNADRWREATPRWPDDVASYRQMLVNHEVGHLLGQYHPADPCPDAAPAPVMAQQSTVLDGCLPNPWPLDWEIDCAALGLEPLAPGHEDDPEPRCGPDGPTA